MLGVLGERFLTQAFLVPGESFDEREVVGEQGMLWEEDSHLWKEVEQAAEVVPESL